jgi:PadR family transcriptional regulator, regulatory protein AphA
MLKYILLGFLNYHPMTGYDLKTIMEQSTMHFWHAYHSQIYTTLRKLEDEGMVTSEEEAGDDKLNRRIYHLTDKGRADWQAWLNTALTEQSPVKEELLVRIFFSAQRDPQALLDELHVQRQLHQQKLSLYQSLIPSFLIRGAGENTDVHARLMSEAPFWAATLDFGIRYEQMYIAWLNDVIRHLKL